MNMKILVVCSGNAENFSLEKNQAFIYDQIKSIENLYKDIEFEVFALKGRGMWGYLYQLKKLKQIIRNFQPDIVHAHGGHVGLLCTMQRKVPIIVTFHGSDINFLFNRCISFAAALFSGSCIFVSKKLKKKMPLIKGEIIPCGVDLSVFFPMPPTEAKKMLGLNPDQKYLLFPSSFSNKIKNFPLAQKVADHFPQYQLLEISNRSREEVNLLLNAAEALLITSFSEGSPQIVKEALACNLRVVSVNVGDISEQLDGVEGCFCCDFNAEELIEKLKTSLATSKSKKGREKASLYDNRKVAARVVSLYSQLIRK